MSRPQIIELENARLESDGRYQWILYRKTDPDDGEPGWAREAYCRNLEVALLRLARMDLRHTEAESLEELRESVEELTEKIEDVSNNVKSQIDEILDE